MRRIKEKWPVYLVNTLGLLALGYFMFIVLFIFRLEVPAIAGITDSRSVTVEGAYLFEEDPDSVYKRSLEDLSYREYKRKSDSINYIQHKYTQPPWNGFIGAPFGAGYCNECDSCIPGRGDFNYSDKGIPRYYLAIPGFKVPKSTRMEMDPPVFYKKAGMAYMKYFRVDTVREGEHKGRRMGHWLNKVVRYRVLDNTNDKEEGKQLLIPISKTTYSVLDVLCWAVVIINVLVSVLVARSFILVLIDIARGRVFEVKNYRRLFFMGYGIAFSPVYSLVVQVILQWSYRSWYAGDLSVYIDWQKYLGWLLAALVAFMLAIAFRKGYRIQQEQDLTI